MSLVYVGRELYIWRIGIALHSALRYFGSYIYYHFYQDAVRQDSDRFGSLVKFTVWLNVVEISCLILLTYISSTDDYGECSNFI